jgi:hypothetical protein
MRRTTVAYRAAQWVLRRQERTMISLRVPAAREPGVRRRTRSCILILALAAHTLAACGDVKVGKSEGRVGSHQEAARVFELQLLSHPSGYDLTDEHDEWVEKKYVADGWRMVRVTDLPKTLNQLGANGWELVTWCTGGILLRRASVGGESVAIEYKCIAHRFHGQEAWPFGFTESREEGMAAGWIYIDPAESHLHKTMNELGAQGWDVSAWQEDAFIILSRPAER